MRTVVTRQRVFFAALGVLVVALLFGSVQTTGALWADQANGPSSNLQTGNFGLSAGSGSNNVYSFPALAKTNMADGDSVSATLNLVNTGTTPLRFRLRSAGPIVSAGGATVTMNLAGTIGACPGAGVAFTAANTTAPTQTFTTPGTGWHDLAKGGSTAWCITAKLIGTSGGTGGIQTTFTVQFNFDAQQVRP